MLRPLFCVLCACGCACASACLLAEVNGFDWRTVGPNQRPFPSPSTLLPGRRMGVSCPRRTSGWPSTGPRARRRSCTRCVLFFVGDMQHEAAGSLSKLPLAHCRYVQPPCTPPQKKQAWDLYYHVFKRINKQLHSLTTLELQYVAPALVRAQVRSRVQGSPLGAEALGARVCVRTAAARRIDSAGSVHPPTSTHPGPHAPSNASTPPGHGAGRAGHLHRGGAARNHRGLCAPAAGAAAGREGAWGTAALGQRLRGGPCGFAPHPLTSARAHRPTHPLPLTPPCAPPHPCRSSAASSGLAS